LHGSASSILAIDAILALLEVNELEVATGRFRLGRYRK